MNSIYSVSQVNTYIKNMFEQDFYLRDISIKGEVSNCTYHGSGHIYFTIKDNGGVLSCIMFKSQATRLKFRLEKGQNVIVSGNISVYERDGKYQLYAKEIQLEGTGNLYLKFEELKRQLEEMGMFDQIYKKKIPNYALKIGVCTAKTGAAIQDIINITGRRNPFVQLYLYPTLVQGQGAAQSIVNGIRCLDSMNLDIIIVGRGGGSIEDLWAFNEEIVARAIFECRTPIISAVGHETDTTIADFVADLRAPTPSAAAELAVFDILSFKNHLQIYTGRLDRAMLNRLSYAREKLAGQTKRISYLSPETKLKNERRYLDELYDRINFDIDKKLVNSKHRLAIVAERLKGLSPLSKLSHGFAFIESDAGCQIKGARDLSEKQNINIHFRDGSARAQIIDVNIEPLNKGEIDL